MQRHQHVALTNVVCFVQLLRDIMVPRQVAVAGSKYELPKYVLSNPANLVSERDSKQQHAQQVELVARRL